MQIANRLKDLKPSQTLQITAKAKQLKKEGKDIINFAAGEPDFDTPQKIKDSAIKAIQEGFTKYTPESGIPELRQAISQKFKKDNSLDFTPDQIVVSCGAKHSIYNSLQVLIDRGDEVIIISPYWLSYPHMVRLAEGIPVILETFAKDDFKIDFNRLKKIITKRTKALIINSPSNPTGCVYSKEELERIAEIAVNKNIWVISDEIYEKLIYDGNRHVSIASLGAGIYNKTITVNGVSKTYSMTGWRIGYLGAPLEIAKAVSMLQSHSTSHPTSISQKATLAALAMQEAEIAPFVKEFKARRDCLIEKLGEIKQISSFKPKGAFYCFVDISSLKISPREFASRLLEEEFVAVIPAESFGSDKHIRLSFATNQNDLIRGTQRIKDFIAKLA